jgi:uncharacterized membrane protein
VPNALPLLGVVILLVGLRLRLRPTVVVVAAAIVTGLLAGLPIYAPELPRGTPSPAPPEGIINMLGRAFANNRLVSLFIITFPAIALAERYGLQERAGAFIRRIRAATVGKLLIAFQLFRIFVGALGIRLNGHPAFVRPLIYPMSRGAAAARAGVTDAALDEHEAEAIKAADAAAENYGNFFGQNLSPVQPGILLVFTTLATLGYQVSLWRMILFTTPIVLASIVLGAIQFRLLDRRYARRRDR